MILMQLNQVRKYFGADLILSDIKLEVHNQDRIAIVGRNGAGKSTLLKIMAGELSYEGEIYQPKDLTIGYLEQHSGLNSTATIWDEMLTLFEDTIALEKDLRAMEVKMADPDEMKDEEAYQQLLQDYDRKQNLFQSSGGFQYEAEIESVLHGLDFGHFDFSTPVNELSGGQKTRLALAKLLLAKPQLLILDEPTNHLDIRTLSWLEAYLRGYDGAIVIVSHDRYFLDRTISTVYEVTFQRTKKYHGNYSYYLTQRAKDYELELKQYEKQQAEVKQLEDFIQRNIARDSTSNRAKARRKQLEKMELMDRPTLENKSTKFSFSIQRKSGNDVLKVENLMAQYEDMDEPVFQKVNFHVNRGDRLAIVGPNGVGKSTLLKAILKKLAQVHGTIQVGTNVQFGYYDQEQASLHPKKTVLQELWDDYPQKNEKDVRTILGNFLFSGDDVLKTVGMLSGGEKARLLLSKLMLQQANVLVMDEPTNHLDLDSKEVLEAALADFPGTILFVSHDRYFINRIATQVMELTKEGSRVFLGDYDYYVEKIEEEAELEELARSENERESEQSDKHDFQAEKEFKREYRKVQRKLEAIEEEISKTETTIEQLEETMSDPEIAGDYSRLQSIQDDLQHHQHLLEKHMEEWEQLQLQMDGMQ
ncbi:MULTISPECIES: ABC-F family ATP-binding cassette domain-containing protein [Allobacillus]|uniref:ABC-F family ATP-binding cassette domain-containing protein n=1 Tax=Allobacillus halotolerans TaxID=570278 RepID=A0ABS6GRX6_9BACI|nr:MULTISPECIES: ABC-F family ATP-binding cassette domain-containing protein [Allobacillus]MBU6081380.1 ABC-F family ATP-binding cassette domain-containing protein [Allobacillus halotolerans]TSJ61872.1 ABC-F family ATP-binding cassette domain-containing protein [Allobacillus sp. SKP2-8]